MIGKMVGSDRALLCVEGVSKRFGDFSAVDQLSLQIGAGEFFALLGPSGCGKTTLLRMLAGFESPDAGRILLDGEDIAPMPPHLRPVNMMFQNYALFPHLSAANNIAFGLKRAGLPKAEIEARVDEMIALARLQGLERRRPDQMSGGQRQRVALARALARRPRVLLLDEPLAALDKKLREDTQTELKDVQRRLGTTFVIVTHDQDEAMTVADRIGVMDKGKIIQVGTPRELYEAPNSRWIAGFVGDINMIEGCVSQRNEDVLTVATEVGDIAAVGMADTGAPVCIAIRPEKITLLAESAAVPEKKNTFGGELQDIGYLGGTSIYRVKLDRGPALKVSASNVTRSSAVSFSPGQRVVAAFSPGDCVVLRQ